MDKRFTFNEDVKNYDNWRPTYCKELFNDIIQYSQLNQNKKAVEVGIGTGQATTPFLMTGCDVTAIELGKNLAEYSKEKFKEYNNFSVYNTSFEDFECNDNSFDILYSATAFHWIPEDIGYPKAFKLLKNNGTLALFWNKPSMKEDDLLHQKFQTIYQKYTSFDNKSIESAAASTTARYNRISKTIQSYGFRDVEIKLYHQTRVFDSSGYISLLETYSDHRMLESSTKKLLYSEIENTILEYGNTVTIYDTIELYLARK
ncbi:class I SAM-dependent methyltransferase [Oceanirhabdus seepicola]|uniref:Class I SAM-dependent methyltransferase n=1 Tax=Oceanirhabdus seepicola TaxID=2828781 RepID=A0A9J6P9U3_9CLOT|nr:class I SAM-dependent methyltransferase [Oceanirhabdus seepicola]MCM1992197.1 class I SAM-dependent methyltransferase [Oceanirhabdus seepicola]